jgi:hypothetical protein
MATTSTYGRLAHLSPYGVPEVDNDIAGNARFATKAMLKAVLPVNQSYDGLRVGLDDGSQWRYVAASTATDATENLVLTPAPAAPAVAPATGRWCRYDREFDLELAIGFATADAAVLFTVPVGFQVRLNPGGYFAVTTSFTGGTSSAIGLSSSNAANNTKGDLLGGATGNVAADLTAGSNKATAGADYAAGGQILLVAGDTIRFDRITSAFTAGAGKAVLPCRLVAVP